MDKLISMTDFILEQCKVNHNYRDADIRQKEINYANFLRQPLTLGMFVPVMSNGIIPTEEEIKTFSNTPLFEEYQEAKGRVLFEGFEILKPSFLKSNEVYVICEQKENTLTFKLLRGINKTDSSISEIETIECISKHNLVLTESAKKQILGL